MSASVVNQQPQVAEMVVIHKVFRRELALLPQLIRRVAEADVERAGVLVRHGRLVLDGLHSHHEGEDELLWPKLLERAPATVELLGTMQGQHDRIAELVQQVTDELGAWERSADAALRDHVAARLDELRRAMVRHLDQEEALILPLVSEHIAPDEWAELGERGRNETPRDQLPLMFGAILEEATPQERALMLAPVPAPIKLMLFTVGARKYRRYVREVRTASTGR